MNRRAPIFVAIAMVLLVIVVVFLAILPKMTEVREAREELDREVQNEQFLLLELDRLREARAQLPEVRRRLAKFTQKVPATADLPGLIRLLQNAADASGLSFFSISPQPPVVIGGAAPLVPVPPADPAEGADGEVVAPPVVTAPPDASVVSSEVVVIGNFFEVDQFLFRLETLPRAAKVMSIEIDEGPNATDIPGQIQVTLLVQVFTTDPNAGPGSTPDVVPDPTLTTPAPGATTPVPGATPTTAAPTAGG